MAGGERDSAKCAEGPYISANLLFYLQTMAVFQFTIKHFQQECFQGQSPFCSVQNLGAYFVHTHVHICTKLCTHQVKNFQTDIHQLCKTEMYSTLWQDIEDSKL